jgi:hypothetical protein
MTADQVIRWTTAGAVVGVVAVAAVASYEHTYALVRAHGEAGWTGRLVPLTVDELIYASSMVMLDSARRKIRRSLAIVAEMQVAGNSFSQWVELVRRTSRCRQPGRRGIRGGWVWR